MGIHFSFKSPKSQEPGLFIKLDPIANKTKGHYVGVKVNKNQPDSYKLIEDDRSSIESTEARRLSGHMIALEGLPVERQQTDIARVNDFAAPADEVKPAVPKQARVRKFLHDADRAGRDINPIYKFASRYVSSLREEKRAKKEAVEQAFLSR